MVPHGLRGWGGWIQLHSEHCRWFGPEHNNSPHKNLEKWFATSRKVGRGLVPEEKVPFWLIHDRVRDWQMRLIPSANPTPEIALHKLALFSE